MIDSLKEEDIETIAKNYCQSWTTPQELKEKWQNYYQQQQAGTRIVCMLRKGNELLGYGSHLLNSQYPHFANIPEIHDLWIYEPHRKQSHALRLVAWFEEIAKQKGFQVIGIGVGLYADYGTAQKLYVTVVQFNKRFH